MLTSHDIESFRGTRDGERLNYEEAVGVVRDKVKGLAIGVMEITYEGERGFYINPIHAGKDESGLPLRLSKGQIAALLTSNPQSAHQILKNLTELEGYVEQAFSEGLITWEQRNVVVAMAMWNDRFDPHEGLGMLRMMLKRREWLEFLKQRKCITRAMEAKVAAVSPAEGLLLMMDDIFRKRPEFQIDWDSGFHLEVISDYIRAQNVRMEMRQGQ